MAIFLDFLKLLHSLVDTKSTMDRTDRINKKWNFFPPSNFYKLLRHFQNLASLGNFFIFFGNIFCMLKIDVHTNLHEKIFKIGFFLLKTVLKSMDAKIYAHRCIYIYKYIYTPLCINLCVHDF